MIKVAIAGADTPIAGEIIRILANHPEVTLATLSAPGKEGIPVRKIHHGLVGKGDLKFSDPLPVSPECSVLFVCGSAMTGVEITALQLARPDIKMIFTEPISNLDEQRAGVVFGLPEINRKMLVRGAISSKIPSAITVAALVPLYPLGLNMLLNDSLSIKVEAPSDIIEKDKERSKDEILRTLCSTQLSFPENIDIEFKSNESTRNLQMEIMLNCNVSMDQIMEMMEIYSDHNFAFPVMDEVLDKETIGTPNCVFSINMITEGKLRIRVSLDPRMRGGASEAVHNMNLLFGLHEKTGLEIKASEY